MSCSGGRRRRGSSGRFFNLRLRVLKELEKSHRLRTCLSHQRSSRQLRARPGMHRVRLLMPKPKAAQARARPHLTKIGFVVKQWTLLASAHLCIMVALTSAPTFHHHRLMDLNSLPKRMMKMTRKIRTWLQGEIGGKDRFIIDGSCIVSSPFRWQGTLGEQYK